MLQNLVCVDRIKSTLLFTAMNQFMKYVIAVACYMVVLEFSRVLFCLNWSITSVTSSVNLLVRL